MIRIPEGPRFGQLTISTLQQANVARIPFFRDANGQLSHSEEDGSDWSDSDWLQAVLGELGELANMMKKVRRGDMSPQEARPAIGKELADVLAYLSILAFRLGHNLAEVSGEKYNEVSERVEAPVLLIGHHLLLQGEVVA